MYDKLSLMIKNIKELRSRSETEELTERLQQIETDGLSLREMFENYNPSLNISRMEDRKQSAGDESATIMIVDDEEMVLKVTCIIISKMGLKPLAFKSSSKALDYYKVNYESINLVLLDMIMPEMNGKELFLSMKEINPDVKAILLSGWIDKDENKNIHDIGLVDFLHKPIEKAVLETNIRKALG